VHGSTQSERNALKESKGERWANELVGGTKGLYPRRKPRRRVKHREREREVGRVNLGLELRAF
jgi:hypothetical protein